MQRINKLRSLLSPSFPLPDNNHLKNGRERAVGVRGGCIVTGMSTRLETRKGHHPNAESFEDFLQETIGTQLRKELRGIFNPCH